MARTPRIAIAGIVLAAIGIVAWMRCGGTETTQDAVDVAPTPERAPTKAPATSRHAPASASTEAPPKPVDPAPTNAPPTSTQSEAPPELAAPPREITLYVADEGGAPVAGLWAHVDKDDRGLRAQGRTDAAGTCKFVAAGGPRRIDVAEKIVPGRCFLPVGLLAVEATQTEVRIRLREGAAIEGRVVDEREASVVRVTVTAVGPDGFHNEIATDTDGGFRVPAPIGSRCDLRLGFQTQDVFLPDEDHEGSLDGVAAGTSGVVIRCRRIAKDRALSVLVVDPSGAPRPGAYVPILLVAVVQGGSTDKDGRCRFSNLPARELTATAAPLGGGPDDLYAPSLPVKFVPEGQEIVLQLRRAILVRVAAVDAAGGAVTGLRIVAKRAEQYIAGWRTDASGHVTLKLPPDTVGPIRVEARDDGYELSSTPRGTVNVDVPTDREIRIVVAR